MSTFAAIIIATTAPMASPPQAHAPSLSLSTAASHASTSTLSIAASQQALPRHNRIQLTPTIQADISGILTVDETQTSMVGAQRATDNTGDGHAQDLSLHTPPSAPDAVQSNTDQSETASVDPTALPDELNSNPEEDNVDDDIIVVTAVEDAPKSDPLRQVNAETYAVMQDVDDAVVAPVAKAYEEGLPSPLRNGLNNFFSNLGEPVVFVNFLLQGKPGKAMETLGRFAINTTLGIGGLRDVAKTQPFNLPPRDNGFSNTLGYYGVGHGPFFVLPLVGATTLRDLAGGGVDNFVMPVGIAQPLGIAKYLTHPAVGASAFTLGSLDDRVKFDEKLQNIKDSTNPYNVMRETYLCERKADIEALHNREGPDCSIEAIETFLDGPLEEYEDELDESLIQQSVQEAAQDSISADIAPDYAPIDAGAETTADGAPAADFVSESTAISSEVEAQIEPTSIVGCRQDKPVAAPQL